MKLQEKKKILVISVGGAAEPIVKAIKIYNPDFVYFFCSSGPRGSEKTIDSLGEPCGDKRKSKCPKCDHEYPMGDSKGKAIVFQAGLMREQYEIVTVDDPDNLDVCYQKLIELMSAIDVKYGDCHVIANYTSGTKTMSVAMVLVGINTLKCDLSINVGPRVDMIKKRFIEERDATWKDVAFKAAHKLGNPIDAIDTYLQGLKRRLQDKRTADALIMANNMDVSIEEAKTVISQFKSLNKSQEIKPHPLDIIPLIQHACNIAREKGVIVSIPVINNHPKVMVDPEKMAECFNELVSNALNWFDKPDKKIIVKIDKIPKTDLPEGLNIKQQYFKFFFEDNGCGVSFENKEKIFAPFYTTDPHGTGIGLSLVKKIIEVHGGQIREIGKPGEGANFEMYLPLAKERKEE